MGKSIKEFLPNNKKLKSEKTCVQGRIDMVLAEKARKIMANNDLTWNEVISAGVNMFVLEMGK